MVGCTNKPDGDNNDEIQIIEDNNTIITDNKPVIDIDDYKTKSYLNNSFQIVNSSAIEGITIRCGDLELITTLDTKINCVSYPIVAYIGDYKIGKIDKETIDETIFLQDLLEINRGALMHPELTKLSIIFQSLDEDNIPYNGLVLSQNKIDMFNSYISNDRNLSNYTFLEVEGIIKDIQKDIGEKGQVTDYTDAQTNAVLRMSINPYYTNEQRNTYYGATRSLY